MVSNRGVKTAQKGLKVSSAASLEEIVFDHDFLPLKSIFNFFSLVDPILV